MLPVPADQTDPDEWKPIFTLPNFTVDISIDGGMAALVPMRDERITKLGNDHPRFATFLRKFTDAFGQPLQPCVLLVRRDAPRTFHAVDAIASLRDLIALSVALYGNAQSLLRHQNRTRFGNTFAFYPWMLDRQYDDLFMRAVGHMGVHDLDLFAGQSLPEVFISHLHSRRDFDRPLLHGLLAK